MTDLSETEPELLTVRALDLVPYKHALWCKVGGHGPIANQIVAMRVSEDGQRLMFMLDSHNFLSATPDEMVDCIVELPEPHYTSERTLREAQVARDWFEGNTWRAE